MKFILSFIIAIAFLTSCTSKKSDPSPTPTIVGTWQETTILSITYNNNIAIQIDTLPVGTTGNGVFYSTYNSDGSYQSYLLTAGVKSSAYSGTYTLTDSGATLNQSIPSDPQVIIPSIPARQRANITTGYNIYALTFLDANHVKLIYTLPTYPPYDPGTGIGGGLGVVNTNIYSTVRILTRVN